MHAHIHTHSLDKGVGGEDEKLSAYDKKHHTKRQQQTGQKNENLSRETKSLWDEEYGNFPIVCFVLNLFYSYNKGIGQDNNVI